jgi:hypothetical protein
MIIAACPATYVSRPRKSAPALLAVARVADPLLGLSISLDRHAAEDDLLAIIVAGLRNEHLKGPYLIIPGGIFRAKALTMDMTVRGLGAGRCSPPDPFDIGRAIPSAGRLRLGRQARQAGTST